MWLPETACNDDVLGLLIDEGLRFVILAPQQARRVRSKVAPLDWQSIAHSSIDTSIAYNYFHRDGSGRSLAVFFYDPQLAQAIAFEQALSSSASLVERFVRRTAAAGGTAGMINVATDGETYGHHHKFGELCLAYALAVDAPARGFRITNYGDFLDQHPPELEVGSTTASGTKEAPGVACTVSVVDSRLRLPNWRRGRLEPGVAWTAARSARLLRDEAAAPLRRPAANYSSILDNPRPFDPANTRRKESREQFWKRMRRAR